MEAALESLVAVSARHEARRALARRVGRATNPTRDPDPTAMVAVTEEATLSRGEGARCGARDGSRRRRRHGGSRVAPSLPISNLERTALQLMGRPPTSLPLLSFRRRD